MLEVDIDASVGGIPRHERRALAVPQLGGLVIIGSTSAAMRMPAYI
jgi:hypothetical protein